MMVKFMVKCLNVSQSDTVPFQTQKASLRQPHLKAGKDHHVVEDPTKMKYFDAAKMREIYMERCSDTLYGKI